MRKSFASVLMVLFVLLLATVANASVVVNVNGTNYTIPQTNEKGWGNNVTTWIQAITLNSLQPIGGNFTLTNDVNFGANFGLVSSYYKSRTASIAGSGVLRLANTDSVAWRNAANSGDVLLSVNGSNALQFSGISLADISSSQTLTNKTLTGNTAVNLISGSGSFVLPTSGTITAPNGTDTLTGLTLTQTLTNKTLTSPTITGTGAIAGSFTGSIALPAGSAAAPSLAFTGDTSTGLYHVGATDMSFVANGHTGLEIKDNVTFANVGMGSIPSGSSNYPLLIQRTNVSTGTYMQISNPDTSASSKATYQLAADNGNNNAEISLFTAATTTDAYANSMTVRPSGVTGHLSLIAGDNATNDIRFYVAGDYTSAGRAFQINADKSLQFMQEIVTPANPAAGTVKLYAKSGDRLYHLNSAGVESKILAGTAAIADGGTGQVTANAALNALLPTQGASAGKYLKTDGTNTSWSAGSVVFTAPTIQKLYYTDGTSKTYTTPAGVLYIRVRMVGGGGGGGTGSNDGVTSNPPVAGANTIFGTLTAAGGGAGGSYAGVGGLGGAPTVGAGFTAVISATGDPGQGGSGYATQYQSGGSGGATPFLGAGRGSANAAGTAAAANSGSGGGGGGTLNAGATGSGGGGGSGAYIEATATPAATYSYTVGAGGPGGFGVTAGAGYNGGNGGGGVIIVEEFYQ